MDRTTALIVSMLLTLVLLSGCAPGAAASATPAGGSAHAKKNASATPAGASSFAAAAAATGAYRPEMTDAATDALTDDGLFFDEPDPTSVNSNADFSVVLARPDAASITANILTAQAASVYLTWGSGDAFDHRSETFACSAILPAVIVMDGLEAGRSYNYRVNWAAAGSGDFAVSDARTFSTPKPAGTSFVFAIESDAHILNKADPDLLALNMRNIASYRPDFLMDLGDTFLNDQTKSDPQYQDFETIRRTYLQPRPYFDLVTRSASLFQAIGNHEGEYGYYVDGTPNSIADMAAGFRKTYYPNPVPNDFYTGNVALDRVIGLPEDYYAYTWGDALFVVIDPYRYCTAAPTSSGDGWQWSMGKVQYDWFRKTLEESGAKFKFVFSHHAIGNIRGGAEVADLFEWGGHEQNGNYAFDTRRPGWGKPIRQVMADTGVTIFFQGHDHLYAREIVDGVVYQTLPKPAERVPDLQSNWDAYPDGDVLLNSGFLAVKVTPDEVRVDYFRNYFVSYGSQEGNTGVVCSYTVDAARKVTVLKTTDDDVTTYANAPGATAGATQRPKATK